MSHDPIQIPSTAWEKESTLEVLRNRDARGLFHLARAYGISQTRLATATGLAQGRISEVMTGKRQIQSMEVWARIADGMHIPPAARGVLGLAAGEAVESSRSSLIVPEKSGSLSELLLTDLEGKRPVTGWSPALASSMIADLLAGGSARPHLAHPVASREGGSDWTTQALEDATTLFSNMDYRYGGGFGRTSLVEFVKAELKPLLDSRIEHSPEFLSAAAVLLRLTAWTTYDVGQHDRAQGYFKEALKLAQRANNKMLIGRILAGMSHQANFIGQQKIAVQLARTAQMSAKNNATPTAMALFSAMEARALAGMGERSDCEKALSEAEVWLSDRDPQNDPPWLQYFDEAELHAEIAHSYRDLGVADRAIKHANLAVDEHTDLYARSRAFCQMVEAVGHLDQGEVDHAMALADGVAGRIDVLRSRRVVSYVEDFLQRLSLVNAKNVTNFNQRVRATLANSQWS